jgi:hypothetical protein
MLIKCFDAFLPQSVPLFLAHEAQVITTRALQHERDDGFPFLGIVFESVHVPLVIEETHYDLVQDDEAADHEPSH